MGFSRRRRWSQLYKYVNFLFFAFIFFSTINISYAKVSQNELGNYLEWIYAKEINDVTKLKKTYKNISLSEVSENTLEELLFESIIFDDWQSGKEISLKLIESNKGNTVANFFLLVENFLDKKKLILQLYQKVIFKCWMLISWKLFKSG